MRRHAPGLVAMLVAVTAAALLVGACAPPSSVAPSGVRVVAAENVWGSIARQLGGTYASVTSIIDNPNTDPHDYEPTVADARAISTAQMVVTNGVGYDPWAARLVAASPDPARVTVDVGLLVGVPAGGDPHRWYHPSDVHAVIAAITDGYKKLDPANAAYYDARRRVFETIDLARYDSLIADIKAKYAGTPIGASESVVTGLAEATGLVILTPERFMAAVSEGTGPNAADKATVDAQIRSKEIKVLIYNRQNATPDVAALVQEARTAGVPVVTVTETMVPVTGTFQDWQTAQLERLEAALHQATGK